MHRSIIVPLSRLDRAFELAQRSQVEIAVHEIPSDLVDQWLQDDMDAAGVSLMSQAMQSARVAQLRDMLLQRAASYRLIEVVRPAPRGNEPLCLAYAELTPSGRVLRFDHGATRGSQSFWEANVAPVNFAHCDVCNKSRKRTTVYILQQGDQLLQVGGDCAETLGASALYAAFASRVAGFLADACGDSGINGAYAPHVRTVSPASMYAHCVEAIRASRGFVSREKAQYHGRSTGDTVAYLLQTKLEDARYLRAEDRVALLAARESLYSGAAWVELQQCLAWFETNPPDLGDVLRNALPALQSGDMQHIGLIAYCVSVYLRQQAISRVGGALHPYVHVETVGTTEGIVAIASSCGMDSATLLSHLGAPMPKKQGSKVKNLSKVLPGVWVVTNSNSWLSDYGWCYRFRFARVSDGAVIQWVTSAPPEGLCIGDECVILAASVGEVLPPHPKYGINGTKVTRVTLVNVSLEAHKARIAACEKAPNAAP